MQIKQQISHSRSLTVYYRRNQDKSKIGTALLARELEREKENSGISQNNLKHLQKVEL